MPPPNIGFIRPLQVLEQTDCFFWLPWNTLLEDFPDKVQVQVRCSLSWRPRDSLQPDIQAQILLFSLLPSHLCWIEVFLQVKAFGGDNNIYKTFQIDQGLFCHDQVSSGKSLEFFNLWRNLQMFLDTMEPKTENKNSSLEKTVLIMWAQIFGIIT